MTDTKTNIYTAMLKAQGEFDRVVKTETAKGEKFSYTYANLEQLIEKTQPHLASNGLLIMQFPINEEDRVGVLTILAHESGETIERQFTTKYFRQDPQGIGSLITYFRRYAYMAVLNIAPEDDDAQGAMPVRITTQMEGGSVSEPLLICPEHNVAYEKKVGKFGEFYSHTLEGGGYCNKK